MAGRPSAAGTWFPRTALSAVAADVRRLQLNSEFGIRNSELDRASSRRLLRGSPPGRGQGWVAGSAPGRGQGARRGGGGGRPGGFAGGAWAPGGAGHVWVGAIWASDGPYQNNARKSASFDKKSLGRAPRSRRIFPRFYFRRALRQQWRSFP